MDDIQPEIDEEDQIKPIIVPDSMLELGSQSQVRAIGGEPATVETRMEVVYQYFLRGTVGEAARATGVSKPTIEYWKKSEWWDDALQVVKLQFGHKMASKFARIMDIAADELEDRLRKGETVLIKTENGIVEKKVRVKAKDAAYAIAIAQDKRAQIEGLNVRRADLGDRLTHTERQLRQLAAQVNAKVLNGEASEGNAGDS